MSAESAAVHEAATRVHRQALEDERVVERAKLLLLDFTSVVLATHRPDHDRMLAAARRGPAPHALAFALSARDHFHDFDDIYDRGRVHVGPVTWPALLAMPDTSGRELLAAYASTATVLGVLAEAAAPWQNPLARNWFLTQTLGGLSSAVACSLAAGADAGVMGDALGLAYMQACGTKEPAAGTGSSARRIYPAFGAQGGVLAYELAAAGFDGPPAWASGTAGLGRVYLGDTEFGTRLDALLAEASAELVCDIACKPWPCCRSTHRYLDGLRTLLDVAPAAGAGGAAGEIELTALSADVWLLEPVAGRTHPPTIADGKYSIPFVLAMALTRGVRLGAWDAAALTDPAVTGLAETLSAGRTLADTAVVTGIGGASVTCEQPAASAWGIDDAVAKYHECADYAGVLPAELRDRLLVDVLRLDELDSVHGSAVGEVLLRA
ncbi:MmgE/PrpD family protein [Actinophytocola sp.]|uniref:MmgE/PrpD family protein n=1 Tax=Actinophytocola sp. TaxID=1872138 RepID=UPI003D6A06E2